MVDTRRRTAQQLFVAAVTGMAIVWVVLLVDLVSQTRWLDVALLLVVTALVVVGYVVQRRSRPSTG